MPDERTPVLDWFPVEPDGTDERWMAWVGNSGGAMWCEVFLDRGMWCWSTCEKTGEHGTTKEDAQWQAERSLRSALWSGLDEIDRATERVRVQEGDKVEGT